VLLSNRRGQHLPVATACGGLEYMFIEHLDACEMRFLTGWFIQ